MGVTSFSKQLISRHKRNTVIELGSQNIYDGQYPHGTYASMFYMALGFTKYSSIDLNGENFSLKLDLSIDQKFKPEWDMVTDFGTSEHVGVAHGKWDWRPIYYCWKNKHNLLKVGGIMINENPKTGNWPGHGFNYYTKDFYEQLCKVADYKILEIGEFPAEGNTTDGWNVFCVLEKTGDKFPSLNEFKKLDIRQS
jgi:hypothetical protein